MYEGDGLNIAYSRDNRLWGRGIYFAVNAGYSCPDLSYRIPNTDTYEVFSAYVITGDAYDSGCNNDSTLR